MTGTMLPMPSPEELGTRIRVERERQRYSLQAAAKAAHISRDTWRKVEAGESVQDTKRRAALVLLGLDDDGKPVGGNAQDDGYVSSPGERTVQAISNEDLMREILRSRAEYDQLRAEVRDLRSDLGTLSERVDRIEPGP